MLVSFFPVYQRTPFVLYQLSLSLESYVIAYVDGFYSVHLYINNSAQVKPKILNFNNIGKMMSSVKSLLKNLNPYDRLVLVIIFFSLLFPSIC